MKFGKIAIGKKLFSIFREKKDRQELLQGIEELLISSDFGVDFTSDVMDELQKQCNSDESNEILGALKKIIKEKMYIEKSRLEGNGITAVIVFGVNGSGKTTSVGKLAYKLKTKGKKVLIAAADTHRDAAIEQLAIWSRRVDVPLIKQYQGSDPGAVVFDACDSAMSRRVDFLIIDTAGRLHTRERLMEELAKIGRILEKKLPECHKLKLLTLDATTGQNGISQASVFKEYIGVDGIILTKLDSSAKGGIACTISGKLRIPIIYAGTGQNIEDLEDFDIDEYLESIFSSQ
ncbi:MAG: signal recognition particle-docking protein FtsY [Spirochaetota bacterium]